MSDGSLISSCTLALARRFSTTLRRNLQAPVQRACPSSLQRRIRPFLPFFFFLPFPIARALVGADSDNRSLSFRVHRSRLRLPTTMNRHPYFAQVRAISGIITRDAELTKMNIYRDWRNCEVSPRIEVFEVARIDQKDRSIIKSIKDINQFLMVDIYLYIYRSDLNSIVW